MKTAVLSERANQKHRVVEKVGVDAAANLRRKVEEEESLLLAAVFDSLGI